MAAEKKKIGIVGFGLIGSYIYEQVTTHPELGIDVAFVYDTVTARLTNLPQELVLDNIENFASREPDMVCEFAHRKVSADYGAMFLEQTDYFPLSLTAFADSALDERLRQTAEKNMHRMYLPHGGVMGLDAIREGREVWEEVHFIMKKNPKNIDFSTSDFDQSTIKPEGETVVYEGPTRGVCKMYPRNVNTHAAVALAGLGFDRTHSLLVADPSLNIAYLQIIARGGGVELDLRRTESIEGVTGIATLRSVISSVARTAQAGPGTHFV